METSTARGAATSTGITRASKGTASRASPKPKTERISVAVNKIRMMKRPVQSITFPFELTSNRRGRNVGSGSSVLPKT